MAHNLTDTTIKAAKAKEKTYSLAAGKGLRLQVSVAGGKHWQLRYRIDGKENIVSFGPYPGVSLARARQLAEEAKQLVRSGVHPLKAKQEEAAAKKAEAANSLGVVTQSWLDIKVKHWAPYTTSQARNTLDRYVLRDPALAARPIREVQVKEVRVLLQSIASRSELRDGERKQTGALTVARNLRMWLSAIFEFAIERELATVNPMRPLRSLTELQRPVGSIKHNRKLNRQELKQLIEAIDKFPGEQLTKIALQLLMLLFVRTRELTEARWEEFDLDGQRWNIPKERMKARKPHMVPLSEQAFAILSELQSISGKAGWLFPNQREKTRSMSNTTINRALERMGFNGKDSLGFAAHAFRGTASTLLYESGKFRSEVIEIQLAHTERNAVKAAYSSASYVADRIEMMQFWANYIDELTQAS